MPSRSPSVNVFPPFPHQPIRRLPVVETDDGYTVPGVAHVQAAPHRPWALAEALAQRIAASRVYLSFALYWGLPGVEDLRPGRSTEPTFGARKAVTQ